ncbi:hypothetical protein [Salininema proteolyticum]|uniref:Uncharacterized protein n=1 Tax=Salininema proteolyticum TaxID=1607685 RepID=A0ABV8TZJ4_9ACTN
MDEDKWRALAPEDDRPRVSVAAPESPGRHAADPEPVPSTKIRTAGTLSHAALLLSPLLGGFFLALMALELAKQGEREVGESEGFLLGAGQIPHIRRRAKTALGITAVAAAVALSVLVLVLLRVWLGGGAEYGDNTV